MPAFKRPLELVKFRYESPPSLLWEELFGPYPWFVAPYAGERISSTGQRSADVWSEFRHAAFEAVPSEWRRLSPWGQWTQLSQVQFKACLSHNLVRLDKASLSIATVNIASKFQKIGHFASAGVFEEKNRDESRTILPSCFVIDWPGRSSVKNSDFIYIIANRIRQNRNVVFEALRGFAVFEHVAHDIVSALKEHSDTFAEVRLLKNRKDYGSTVLSRPVVGQSIDIDYIKKFNEN